MLVATDALSTPLLRTVAKACDTDPAAGVELIRLSLFEAMCDLVDRYGPVIRDDISKAATASRSQLVRQYVSKRAAGEDVAGVLAGAELLSRISKEEALETRRHAAEDQPRDHGRWATKDAKGKVDLIAAHTAGVLGQLGGKDQQPLDSKSGYQQLAATGRALTYVSGLSGNQAGLAIGALAQAAGEIGPQAENVLGPSVKRTAYRYRGTEKKPSARVQESAHQLGVIAQKLGDGVALTLDEQAVVAKWQADVQQPRRRPGDEAPYPQDAAAAVFASVMSNAQGKSGDELRMEATSQYLAGSLQSRIPSLHHAKISLEAGKMPPSIGYLIDADGDVVSEAQGFNGDHYLPFDLKNLGSLHGGSYVRTRTTGGPTDEDIYTGLMMGARQITVVSHSGVFTLAFDKDVRGGRRYSDKARQMVDRYAALLDQIGSGQHMEIPFDQDTERELREKAIAAAPRSPEKQQELLSQFKRERLNELAFRDDDELRDEAVGNVTSQYKQGNMAGVSRQIAERDTQDEFHDLSRARDAAQARAYKLDGKGYEAALVALQQEFPFYLQTPRYETWRDYLSARSLRPQQVRGKAGQVGGPRTGDVGYTRRGALVPKKVEGRHAAERRAVKPEAAEATGEPTVEQAAAGAPAVAAPSEAAIRASGITDNVAATVGEATFLVHGLENIDPVPAGMTEADAEGETSPGAYASWVAGTHGSPRAIAQWLMAPTTSMKHVRNMQTAMKYLQQRVSQTDGAEHFPPEFWQQATQDLDDVALLKEPYAKATGPDPVLDVADKPQVFADVPTDTTNFKPYLDFLTSDPGLTEQYVDYADKPDTAIAKDIAAEVHNYEAHHTAGEQIKANDGTIEGLTISPNVDPGVAIDVAEQGHSHGMYQDIARKQKVWSALRGMRIVEVLTGATPPSLGGDAAPKAPEQDEETYRSNPFAKRHQRQLVVHPLGSPASAKLAKRMESRSATSSPTRRRA